jgi:hypothetical protein
MAISAATNSVVSAINWRERTSGRVAFEPQCGGRYSREQ